jgi:hypothetical protein
MVGEFEIPSISAPQKTVVWLATVASTLGVESPQAASASELQKSKNLWVMSLFPRKVSVWRLLHSSD